MTHENLSRRLTASACSLEIAFPTGDSERALGLDQYLFKASGLLAMNPTDKFPVYVIGRYLHSFGGTVREKSERILAVELNLQTFHLHQKGFFVAALPSFAFNLNQDFRIFSVGLVVGRVLNRRLAIQGG